MKKVYLFILISFVLLVNTSWADVVINSENIPVEEGAEYYCSSITSENYISSEPYKRVERITSVEKTGEEKHVIWEGNTITITPDGLYTKGDLWFWELLSLNFSTFYSKDKTFKLFQFPPK